MIIHKMEQRSPEWFAVRLGIPTGSRFGDIYTSQGKPSASQGKYITELAAESLFGRQTEVFESAAMRHGTEYEPEANAFFQFHSDIEVTACGFVTDDEITVGVSPDGLTEFGGLEIKCPQPATHTEYLLAKKCPAKYVPQVQGCMWMLERDHWHFVSYHPDCRKQLVVRVERDDKWIAGFTEELDRFKEKLEKAKQKLA